VATHLENPGNLKAVSEVRKKGSQGKCVLASGQLPRVLFLAQNM